MVSSSSTLGSSFINREANRVESEQGVNNADMKVTHIGRSGLQETEVSDEEVDNDIDVEQHID